MMKNSNFKTLRRLFLLGLLVLTLTVQLSGPGFAAPAVGFQYGGLPEGWKAVMQGEIRSFHKSGLNSEGVQNLTASIAVTFTSQKFNTAAEFENYYYHNMNKAVKAQLFINQMTDQSMTLQEVLQCSGITSSQAGSGSFNSYPSLWVTNTGENTYLAYETDRVYWVDLGDGAYAIVENINQASDLGTIATLQKEADALMRTFRFKGKAAGTPGRVKITVAAKRVEGTKLLVSGTITSPSPITSKVIYRLEGGNPEQGYINLNGSNFTAECAFIPGVRNVFKITADNQDQLSAEQTLIFAADGTFIGEQTTSDKGDVTVPVNQPPGFGGIGSLPGPANAAQAAAGMLLPGLLSIIMGFFGSRGWPGTPLTGPLAPPPSPQPVTGPQQPRDGETRILKGGDGRTYEIKYDSQSDRWINTETGNYFDPDRFTQWQQDVARDKELSRHDMDRMSQRDTQFDRDMDHLVEKQKEDKKHLKNLQQMEKDLYLGGRETSVLWEHRGEPGDIKVQIDKLKEQLLEGRQFDKNLYDKVTKLYRDAKGGNILSIHEMQTDRQIFREAFKDGWLRMGREVITGVDSEGNRSYKSMVLRGLVAIYTGGTSEYVYTPASSLYTMKDYVDRGGDSVVGGFVRTAADVAMGEAFGRVFGQGMTWLGKGGKAVGDYAIKTFPKAARPVVEGIRKVVKELTKKRRDPWDKPLAPPPKIPEPALAPRPGAGTAPAQPRRTGQAQVSAQQPAPSNAKPQEKAKPQEAVKSQEAKKAETGVPKETGTGTTGKPQQGQPSGKQVNETAAKGTSKRPEPPKAEQKPKPAETGEGPETNQDGVAKTGPATSSTPKVNKYYSQPGKQAEADSHAHINMDVERLKNAMQKSHLAAGESGAVYAAPPKAGTPAYEFTNTTTVRISDKNLVDVRIRRTPGGQTQYITPQGEPINPVNLRDKVLMTPAPEGTGVVLTYCDSQGNVQTSIPTRFLERWSDMAEGFVPI